MDQLKLVQVYKSNSQKSINWEGTPQNQTHKSVNNKNTGSQSHQSLFSQGKGMQSSSKKILMPSGSSGTLFRKEIIEMDEVNSSSSSSIGREENANQAFNASNKMKKTVGKLNFTGKPFAPDSIFINNMGKNLGDEDDGGEFDQMSELTTNKPTDQLNQAQQANAQIAAPQKQNVKVLKSIKNGGGNSKKNIVPPRNISPSQKSLQAQFTAQQTSQKQQVLVLLPQSGRGSLNPQISSVVDPNAMKIRSKIQKGNAASKHQNQIADINNSSQPQKSQMDSKLSLSQTQKVRISFVESSSNNMTQLNNISSGTKQEDQRLSVQYQSAHFKQPSIINNSNAQKTAQRQQLMQKVNQQTINGKKLGSDSQGEIERQQQMFKSIPKDSSQYSSQYSNNQNFGHSVIPQTGYSSKSPAEKMIESQLLQPHHQSQLAPLLGQKQKLMTQELQGISQNLLTPSKNQLSARKSTLGSKELMNTKASGSGQLLNNQNSRKISGQSDQVRKSQIQNRQSAKTSSQDLTNLSHDDYTSPIIGSKMRIAQQQQKMMVMSEMMYKQSETVHDEFNLNNEEVIQELDDEEGGEYQPYRVQLSLKDDQFILTQDLAKLDTQKVSPSKSNKVPNSLAFKRRSNDSTVHDYKDRYSMGTADMSYQFNCKLVIEDENNTLTTRRHEHNMFTLQNKDELNRNIPFSKQHNMDFSSGMNAGIYISSFVTGQGYPYLITKKESLMHVIQYLDFENLLKLMSLTKLFREGFTNKPTAYQIDIFKIFKSQLRILLIIGLPSTLQRIQYWNFKTKFFYGKKKKPNYYKTLKKLVNNENAVADIKKDVHRTFPEMKFFQKPQRGQVKLFNILNALANKNSKTGYIQGMNFLAGTILINLQRGEETFWMMCSILNKYKFDSILDLKNAGIFQILCFQLEVFIESEIPELSAHLRKLKIPTDIYAANWFITMFCYELSLDLVFCILDVFLLEGIKSLLRVSLALLQCLESKILQMNYDDCMVFLSHCQKEIEIDSQTLLENAFKFKITNSLLQDLELFYRLKNKPKNPYTKIFKAFNRLQLQEEIVNNKKKSFWIILPATPDDLEELFKTEKNLTEEEILIFYQNNIHRRKLREIVEEMQTEEDSEIANVNSYAIEKKDIQNAKMLQPSQRKKETLHSKYSQSASQQSKKRPAQLLHFKTDSNNTIVELTNDFSRGGQSGSNKVNNNLSYATSQLSAGEKLHSNSSNGHQNLHLSLVMKPSEDMLVTPRKISQINNDLTTKNKKINQNQLSYSKPENESPFINIGTKIKSIFGNFFKTQDKLNKSYEESHKKEKSSKSNSNITQTENHMMLKFSDQQILANESAKKQGRSKSIHSSVLTENQQIRRQNQAYQSTQNAYSANKKPPQGGNNNHENTVGKNIISSQKDKGQYLHVDDNHNGPNTHMLFFDTTTHLQPQVLPSQSQHHNYIDEQFIVQNEYSPSVSRDSISQHNSLIGLRLQRQISKSVERGSEIDSIINEEECELDLLSSSDYAIGTVSENVIRKKQERPEIFITKDLIVGDEEILDSSLYNNMEIQSFNANNKHSQFNFQNSNSLNSSQKVQSNQGYYNQQSLVSMKKQNHFNSNSNNSQNNLNNAKIMKSSPPVSPKERNYNNSVSKANPQVKGSQILINKRK